MTDGQGADDPIAQFSDPGLIHNYAEGAPGYQPQGPGAPEGFDPQWAGAGASAASPALGGRRRSMIVLLIVIAVLVAALVAGLVVR